jgi:hypothetical protein
MKRGNMEVFVHGSATTNWKTVFVDLLLIFVPILMSQLPMPKELNYVCHALSILGILLLLIDMASIQTHVKLTNKRLIIQKTFFINSNINLDLNTIESIKLTQTVPGNILNYGNLIVRTSSGSKIKIKNINDPISLHSHLINLRFQNK